MKRVLFVDDDQMILKLIERKMKSTDIKCHFANSGEEALRWIKQFHIDVMVTDIMMPDMNGLELSSRAQKVSPHTMRIILSGSAQVSAIIDAINEGHVYKYIVKPWKIDQEAIKLLNDAISTSKKWYEEEHQAKSMYFIQTSALSKIMKLKHWILTDDNLAIIEKSDDKPLPLEWRDYRYELVNSSEGVMRLYDMKSDWS